MHRKKTIGHQRALLHENRLLPLLSPTKRQDGVPLGLAPVLRHDGIQAKGFFDDSVQEFQLFQLLKGRVRAVEGGDFGSEPEPQPGCFGDGEPDVREEGGGGVAAGEEDVEQFGADFGFVGGLGAEFVEEDVACVGGFEFIGFVFGLIDHGFGDEAIDEICRGS